MKKIILSLFGLIFSIGLFAQSDNCATATVVTLDPAGQACVTGTTVNATSANTFYGACNPANTCNEVWYTFVTNGATNVFDVIPNGLSNPEIVIYTGGCAGTLETCNTQVGTGTLTTGWGLPTGTQVWIGIMSNQGTEGGFDLCINSTAPNPGGGNTCAGAIPLCDVNASTTVDMTTITPSGAWPDCFGGAVNNDVWFTFTCTQSGTLEWEVTPTGTGAGLVELDWAIWDMGPGGGCPDATSGGDPTFACNYNYDGGNGAAAGMTNPAGGEYNAPANIVAGNTYVILVDYFAGGGTGDMQFDFLPGMTAEIAPVADFTINPAGPTCAANVTVNITDNSTGIPTYDFGDGSPTYTGNNPPNHTYNTPGTYAITATIGGACPSTHTEFVELYGPLATIPTITPETCPGDCDASISLATTGGSGQYTYSWSTVPVQTTPTASNLCSGNYTVTITDAICGNLVEPINIAAPPPCASCVMDSMPIVMTNCYGTPFLGYDVSGNVYFTDPPATGTLTITPCSGAPQVFNAPFASPIAFNFTGLPQTGTNCAFTATFSDDAACTITTNFLSPPPITAINANQTACNNDMFNVNGTVSFNNPPATGTLVVSYNDGVSTTDTIINPPFTSPENWSITAQANGNNYTITAYFSDYPTCGIQINGTAPPSCVCNADVGTFTPTTNGNTNSVIKLCFGDQFTLTSNGDGTPPGEALAPPIPAPFGYNPDIGYLIYSCPPTVFPQDSLWDSNGNPLDPCLIGAIGVGNNWTETNNFGSPNYAGPWVNNTVYYVPITVYDGASNPIQYSYTNTNSLCYDMGSAFEVQYLTEITTAAVADCQDSSVTVTITGGLPEFDGSLYTASNLLPATASFVNNTATHNGTIVINGLLDGDMYSFDIVDTNGCPVTVNGGPFVGLPNANAGVDDTSCTLTYNLNPTTSIGAGTWTGPAGVNFAPNANTPNATVSAATAGTYTLTWTEDNGGGCTSADNVDITLLQPIVTAGVEDCQDSSVTVTITNGLPEVNGSNYTASNLLPATASFVNNTATHNGTITINGLLDGDMYSFDITDDNGCTTTFNGGPFVGLPNANAGVDDTSCTLTYNLNPTTSIGAGTWTGPAGVNFAPNANTPNATVSAATAGTYTLTWTEDNGGGCTSADNVDITLLQPIVTAGVEDCQDSSVTVTITNGLPEVNGSNYTASNLLPATASFVNNTATHNGTITINGLLDGDMYSFDITDDNGCTTTFNSGPFVGLPNANAGVDDTSCTLTYNLNPTTSIGAGTWTGPAGVNFAPNANTPNATVTVPAAGNYTFTWTEDNGGGCISADDVTIRFNVLSIPNTPTNPTCNGGTNGQIILAPQGGTAPYSYQWNAAANNQITNPATNLGAGTYTVTVTDNFGCFLDSTFTLTEPAPFTYTTASQNANCNQPDGWAAVINFAGGTGAYTYDWGAGPTANDTLFNLVPNSYTVTVEDANGCDTTFTINVGNNAGFTASITASTNVSCNGLADGDATADGSDPLANYDFSWNTVPVQNTQTATGLGAGTYIVTITDQATGCTDTASITITEPPLVTVDAGTDVTICSGANTNLSATGNGGTAPYTYSWNQGLGAGQNHNVSPAVTITYTVTVFDDNMCSNTDDVTVTVTPAITVIASEDDTICLGGNANISAVAADGNGGPYNYSWDNGIGAGQSHNVSPASTTTYTVTASDGCTSPDATDMVTIYVSDLPTVSFVADTLSLCETPLQSIEFYNTSPSPSYGEIWTFGNGAGGSGDTTSNVYNAPGSYDVSLTITDSTTGCTNSVTQVGYINIYPNPTADFTMNPQPATMFDPTIYFDDASYTNITDYYWDIAGLDISTLSNPIYTFPEDTGTYPITLTVTDIHGCTNTITKVAIVKGEFGIYVPNSFTPDFDNLNEGFFPNGFGISDVDYNFYIFDRWGELIFESHQKFEPWNGTYKGKLVQNGVYVWRLEFKDINGEHHSKVGHVNVIR